MAFKYTNSKGNDYFLHGRTTKLRNGKEQTLYYFSKTPKENALDKIPEGYKVSETANGLPVLQKAESKQASANK